MEFGIDRDKLERDLDALRESGGLDVHWSSAGKSRVRTVNGWQGVVSPSSYALGHLADTIGGPGTVQKLIDIRKKNKLALDVRFGDHRVHLASHRTRRDSTDQFEITIRLLPGGTVSVQSE